MLAFITGGYYMVFLGFRWKAEKDSQSMMNAGTHFGNGEKLVLKIPLLLPYAHDGTHYEAADGFLMIKGSYYAAEKRIIRNDTLNTVYIKDAYINQLYAHLEQLAGLFSSVPPSNPGYSHFWDNLFREYLPASDKHTPEYNNIPTRLLSHPNPLHELNGNLRIPERPPSYLSCPIQAAV